MAKKKQTIEIPKAVPKKRKAPKPSAIAIPKAEPKAKKPKRKFQKKEKPAQNFSTGSMQNNSLAEAFKKAGLTADSFKKK
jgi:hypothetical protein|tara:strand:+ start:181 stop:420 length:240 start_codon:yes stop_codon:yes gene_type:complete